MSKQSFPILRWLACALSRALEAAARPPLPAEEEPRWVYLIPFILEDGETLEQASGRARKIPGVLDVRRNCICQCGLEGLYIVVPSNLRGPEAVMVAGNPKALPGDILIELWDPAAMRYFDFQKTRDLWVAHTRSHPPQPRMMSFGLPKMPGSGGGDPDPN